MEKAQSTDTCYKNQISWAFIFYGFLQLIKGFRSPPKSVISCLSEDDADTSYRNDSAGIYSKSILNIHI